MKKYLPILFVLVVLASVATVVVNKRKSSTTSTEKNSAKEHFNIGTFHKQPSCARHPMFLKQLNVTSPITIDLSQQHFTGLAFLWGKNFSQVVHPKAWETFEHFSTYALDEQGNAYLAPMPFISIKPTTFNLQKNIYKLDSNSGKLSIFMHFDDVHPSANNPYGIISLVYDCDDKSLWVSAIDETDYKAQRGVIYHIDVATQEVLQKVEGFDALTLTLLKNKKGKYLLAGSARENRLYAFDIKKSQLDAFSHKVLELPSANEHVRKIKIKGLNQLELQTIPFSYTLIAQTTQQRDRAFYTAVFDVLSSTWTLKFEE